MAKEKTALAQLAVLWMLVGVLQLGLSALVPDTALRDGQLPFSAKIGLAAYDLTLLVVAVCVVGGLMMLMGRAARRGAHPVIHWTIGGAQALVIWVAVFLYGASWTAYWNAGVFLDREAFLFWLPHPVQVFHWVYPPLAIGVIVATLVAAAALVW